MFEIDDKSIKYKKVIIKSKHDTKRICTILYTN